MVDRRALSRQAAMLVVAATGGALVVALMRPDAAVPSVLPAEKPSSGRAVDELSELRQRVMLLESKRVVLERTPASPDSGAPVQRPAAPAVEEDKPPEQYLADAESEFNAQPRNQAWAGRAETAYLAELREYGATAGFDVQRVDCRTTHCFAEVEWPDYETALNKVGAILHGEFSHNCTRGVFALPPLPGSAQSRYKHKVLFDCTDPLPSNIAKK